MRELELSIEVKASQAKQELRDLDAGFDKIVDTAQKAGKAADDLAQAADKRLAKSLSAAEKTAKDLDKQLDRLSVTTDKQTTSTGLLSKSMSKFLTGAVIIGAIKATADWADRLEELSVQTGISVTALQKFDKAAKLNGSSAEKLAASVSLLQDRIATGDKSAVGAFTKLGLSMEAFRRLSPEQQVLTLARAVANMTAVDERSAVVKDLLGRAGAQQIPTLIELAQNYDKLSAITEENVKSVAKLSDWWETAKTTGAALLVEMLAPFTVAISSVVSILNRLFSFAGGFEWRLLFPPSLVLKAWQDLRQSINDTRSALRGDTAPLPGAPEDFVPPVVAPPGFNEIGVKWSLEDTNDQIRESIHLHEKQAKAAEEAAEKAKKAAEVQREAIDKINHSLTGHLNTLEAITGMKVKAFTWENMPPALGQFNVFGQPAPGGDMLANGLTWQQYFGGAKPPTWMQRRWGNMSHLQSQWMQSNFSKDNLAGTMLGYGEMVGQIAQGGDPIWNATDRMGRGSRIGYGALAGAQTGMKFGGPWGAAGGALIGAIVGAVRNPAFEDVFKRVAKNFGTNISEETARGIADVAKKMFGGNRQAAEIFSLDKVLAEGGLNSQNIDKMLARFRDAFSAKEGGVFSADQLKQVLDQNFGVFAEYFNNIGGLADKNFTEIIELQRRFGVESAAVAEYVQGQVQDAVGGLEQFLSNATIKSAESANGLMAAAVLMFEELRKGPDGLRGAIERMAPIIASIDSQLQGLGVEASASFNDMRSLLGSLADEEFVKAIDATDGLNKVLIGLHNSALLNDETFRGLAHTVADTYNDLIAKGKDGDHALRLMQPTLQTIWELQTKFGLSVDESTQALLDQAMAAGIVGQEWMSAQDQMVNVLKDVANILGDIRDKMFGIGDAAEDAADQTNRAWRSVEPPPIWNTGGITVEGPEGAAMGGYVTNRGIRYLAGGGVLYPDWRTRGTDTVPAMLTPGEGVLSRRGMAMLGQLNRGEGSGSVVIEKGAIVINGMSDPEQAADAVMDRLRRKGVKFRVA